MSSEKAGKPAPEYALSIRPHWAWLILHGPKHGENRTKNLFRNIPLPTRIFIHATKTRDDISYALDIRLTNTLRKDCPNVLEEIVNGLGGLDNAPAGAIVGEITVTDVHGRKEGCPWCWGPVVYQLAEPVVYDEPIPCRGQLGLWKPHL
jgi:hypothetical protein